MSSSTLVIVKFSKMTISASFFEMLNQCFTKQGFSIPESALFVPLSSTNEVKLNEIKWKDIGLMFSQGCSVKTGYLLPPNFRISISISFHNNCCDRISLAAPVRGFKLAYSKEEADNAYKLEALCMKLHAELNATDTTAKSNYREEPWFRFSKEEWKPLGELPVEKTGS
jgi:hypothetical protein